jgi:hypothetical protein
LRWKLLLAVATLVLGRKGAATVRETQFRQTGEVHRWMYDRVSLRRLLESCGFAQVADCRAAESRIDGFSVYGLDVVQGRARKPDSLFMEATKPVGSVLESVQ